MANKVSSVVIPDPLPCKGCNGTAVCSRCHGNGFVSRFLRPDEDPCRRCGGSGVCPGCRGSGWFSVPAPHVFYRDYGP